VETVGEEAIFLVADAPDVVVVDLPEGTAVFLTEEVALPAEVLLAVVVVVVARVLGTLVVVAVEDAAGAFEIVDVREVGFTADDLVVEVARALGVALVLVGFFVPAAKPAADKEEIRLFTLGLSLIIF
jgi:hypothetical protein